MRELTSHKVNGCNEALTIQVMDEPGSGGANHRYMVADYSQGGIGYRTEINFQNGPIKEVGTNGMTHEALLAILEDRLVGFQSGPYACTDNSEALEHIRKAQEVLQRRTKDRLARGVEGTHTV